MMHHLLLRHSTATSRPVRGEMSRAYVAVIRSGCAGGQHYYVKQGGSWVCTMCGDTR